MDRYERIRAHHRALAARALDDAERAQSAPCRRYRGMTADAFIRDARHHAAIAAMSDRELADTRRRIAEVSR